VLELAGTVTAAGSVTAALLLDRATTSPPAGAAPVSVTVQASIPHPDIELLVQEKVLTAEMPAPLRATAEAGLAEELLAMLSWPVAAPAVAGLNWTFKVKV